MIVYHITTKTEAQRLEATGEYFAATFDTEGFIHCCHPRQLLGVAQRYFKGQKDLVILEVDTSRLHARVVEENTSGGQDLFPHIYGPITKASVRRQIPFSSVADGKFFMPKEIQG